jgi:hypothetical protein
MSTFAVFLALTTAPPMPLTNSLTAPTSWTTRS